MKRVALIFLLAACMPEADGTGLKERTPTVQQIEACHDDGGEIVPGGLLPWACERPLIDGGQSCTTGSDCEGLCLADGAICSAKTPIFGCYPILEDGKEVTICVD